jgi:hypothetical protein
MFPRTALLTVFTAMLAACGSADPLHSHSDARADDQELLAAAQSAGLQSLSIPDEDPGPPFYARVTTLLNQMFHQDGLLAIPFYRPPSCVPADFNMLELFDPPGPQGPGAFACPLLMTGFLLTEPDAPLGTFPRHVVLGGSEVPFWFVDQEQFQAQAADGVVTFAELQAMDRLTATAHAYHETLKPREGDHLIVINARGTLEDGRSFRFHVTHQEDRSRSLQIQIR